MRLSVLFVAIIAICCWLTPVTAATDSPETNTAKDYCVGDYDAEKWLEFIRWGLCDDYVASIGEGLRSGAAVAGYRACLPDEISPSDMNFVVSEYVSQSADVEHGSPYNLVAAALSKSFPCPR